MRGQVLGLGGQVLGLGLGGQVIGLGLGLGGQGLGLGLGLDASGLGLGLGICGLDSKSDYNMWLATRLPRTMECCNVMDSG